MFFNHVKAISRKATIKKRQRAAGMHGDSLQHLVMLAKFLPEILGCSNTQNSH